MTWFNTRNDNKSHNPRYIDKHIKRTRKSIKQFVDVENDISNKEKKRSLCEIYEAGTPNSFSIFALFSQSYVPLTFEAAVKDEVWEQGMDAEI